MRRSAHKLPAFMKGLAFTTKTLASGEKVRYWYAWRGGPRLVGEPGSTEFVQSFIDADSQPIRERVDFKRIEPVRFENAPEWLLILAISAQKRAKSKGIEFSLTPMDLVEIAREAKGRCVVSGFPFTFLRQEELRVNPFVPSIDRIDSRVGYIRSNVRLVCWIVNVALQDWGDKPFLEIVEFMKNNQRPLPYTG